MSAIVNNLQESVSWVQIVLNKLLEHAKGDLFMIRVTALNVRVILVNKEAPVALWKCLEFDMINSVVPYDPHYTVLKDWGPNYQDYRNFM